MKLRRVVISAQVYRQVDAIVDYIALDSIDNALAWEARVLATLNRLADVHGHAVDPMASQRLGHTVRKIVFERTYLIHYRVGEVQIDVLNIRHGARLPEGDEQ